MGAHKKFRQGQILKLLTGEPVASQDDLRRQLIHLGVRVTQATLSRDLRELRLVKTVDGYKPLATAKADDAPPVPALARALKEFLLDIRPAQNMLVLKTPPEARSLLPPRWTPSVGRKSPARLRATTRFSLSRRRAPLVLPFKNAWRKCCDDRPATGRRRRSNGLRRI